MVRGLSSFKKAAAHALQDSGSGYVAGTGSNTPGTLGPYSHSPGLNFTNMTKDGSLTPVVLNKKKNLDIAKI